MVVVVIVVAVVAARSRCFASRGYRTAPSVLGGLEVAAFVEVVVDTCVFGRGTVVDVLEVDTVFVALSKIVMVVVVIISVAVLVVVTLVVTSGSLYALSRLRFCVPVV